MLMKCLFCQNQTPTNRLYNTTKIKV